MSLKLSALFLGPGGEERERERERGEPLAFFEFEIFQWPRLACASWQKIHFATLCGNSASTLSFLLQSSFDKKKNNPFTVTDEIPRDSMENYPILSEEKHLA